MSHPTSSGTERSSSPLLFEDSQPVAAELSLEVLDSSKNDSKNDSKETNVCDDALLVDSPDTQGLDLQRPQQDLFSVRQRLIASTPPQSPSRKPRRSPSSLSLSKNNQNPIRKLEMIEEDTPMDMDAGSFGSVRTPSKRKVVPDSSPESDVEELSKDKNVSPEVHKKKQQRMSVECVYQSSTPLRPSPAPFRAVDVSLEEPVPLESVPEEVDTADDDFKLHFSPSQDVYDKQPETSSSSLKKLNNSFIKDLPSSSSSDSNVIFEVVDKLAAGSKSSPDDLDNSVTIVAADKKPEEALTDTIPLDNSPNEGDNLTPPSKHSSPEEVEEEAKKASDKKEKECFMLVKLKYTAGEDRTMKDLAITWQTFVTLEVVQDTRSSLQSDPRSSVSPVSVSGDEKVKPYPLQGPRVSVASSSSSASSGNPFALPAARAAPRERKLTVGASRYFERTVVLHKDTTIENQNLLFLKSAPAASSDSASQTSNSDAPESVVVQTAPPPVPQTPASEAPSRSSSTRTSRGRKKGSTSRKTPAVQQETTKRAKTSQGRKGTATEQQASNLPAETPDDTPATNGHAVNTGQPVFARWADARFYPGVVGERAGGRWDIHFDDGARRLEIEENIVVVDRLPIGQPIHAVPEAEIFYPGIITQHTESAEGEVQYHVDLVDFGETDVPRSRLSLSSEQAAILRETLRDSLSVPTTPHRPDLSLDNLMDGKRGRSKRQLCMAESPGRGAGRSSRGAANDQPGCSKSDDFVPIPSDSASEVAPWSADWESLPGVENAAWPQLASRKSKSMRPDEKEELGPFPKKKIFEGFTFCLCFSSGQDSESQSELGSEMESQETEAEMREPGAEVPAFNKVHLELQLRKGGGTVVEFFEAHQLRRARDKCLLVTNRCSATAKAVMCLALGVRSVRHKWVAECCKKEKLVPPSSYILPAGHSQKKGTKVEWNHRPKNPRPFSSREIALVSSVGPSFLDFWGRVLSEAKAVRVLPFSCDNFLLSSAVASFDVIVTDSECSKELLEKARQLDRPLVHTSWVVQSLVHGEPVSLEQHSLQTQALSKVLQTF